MERGQGKTPGLYNAASLRQLTCNRGESGKGWEQMAKELVKVGDVSW